MATCGTEISLPLLWAWFRAAISVTFWLLIVLAAMPSASRFFSNAVLLAGVMADTGWPP